MPVVKIDDTRGGGGRDAGYLDRDTPSSVITMESRKSEAEGKTGARDRRRDGEGSGGSGRRRGEIKRGTGCGRRGDVYVYI